jgi:hypothetical protein
MKRILMLVLMVAFVFGCATERGVKTGNIFVSSNSPNMTIQVSTNLEVQSPRDFDEIMGGGGVQGQPGRATFTGYPFIQLSVDKKYVEKAALIIFGSIKAPMFWVEPTWPKADWDGVSFRYYAGRFYDRALANMLKSEGLGTDRRYCGVVLIKKINDATILDIVYIELIPKSLDNYRWDFQGKLTEHQSSYMKEVEKRARESIHVLSYSSF